MKLQFVCLLVVTAMGLTSANSVVYAQQSETSVEPELYYRMVGASIREGSAFYRSTRDKDFVDQFYLSLRLQRTFNFKHLVHFEPAFFTERYDPSSEVFSLDQAYLQTMIGSRWTILAGRKVEFHGSGYAVNPSDLINEDKDTIDRLNQRRGKNLTRVTYSGETFSLGLAYLPRLASDFDLGKGWLLLETFLGNAEIQFQSTYSKELRSTYGLSVSSFITEQLEVHFDGRWQERQRSVSQMQEADFSEHSGNSAYLLLGSRVILASNRSVILEGIWNEAGLFPEELERYYVGQKEFEPENQSRRDEPFVRPVGRQYLFWAYNDEGLVENLRLSATGLSNLQDSSHLFNAAVRWTTSPVTVLSYASTYFLGRENSEFGEQPAQAIQYLQFEGRF